MRKALAQLVSIACVAALFALEVQAARPRLRHSQHRITNAQPNAVLASGYSQDSSDFLLRSSAPLLAKPTLVFELIPFFEVPWTARLQDAATRDRAPPLT
jgi:hypothetical protein